MSSLERFSAVIDEATVRMLSRADNRRGLDLPDVRPRIAAALEKYVGKGSVEKAEILSFIDGIRSDELCLVLACERGDEAAWEELVSQFDLTVRSAARKISANTEDADDLAGSIWAELFGLRQDAYGNKKSKLAYYSGRGSLAGWLRAVVSQLAVDQFRKQSKLVQIDEPRQFDNLAEASSVQAGNDRHVSHAVSPEEIFSKDQATGDVAAALKTAIEKLEAEDRLLLKLYYFDDLKLKEIAATFGYHEATASRKLVRIQSEIRKSVENILRQSHGWSETEVKRHLSETASGLDVSFEKLLVLIVGTILMQDFWMNSVL